MPRVEPGKADVGIYTCGRDTSPQPNVQYIIDVSGLRDPLSNRGFRHTEKDGRSLAVQKFVKEDSRIGAILSDVAMITHVTLQYNSSNPSWLAFSFRDHHGQWIAPAVGELVADHLCSLGYNVSVHHFGLMDRVSS